MRTQLADFKGFSSKRCVIRLGPGALALLLLSVFMPTIAAQPTTTERVSVGSQGEESDLASNRQDISVDGKVVAFTSFGTTLVPRDLNGAQDVFVHDLAAAVTSRVSASTEGLGGNGNSSVPSLSDDGRFVVFTSEADNLVAGDTNQTSDIFLHDRLSRTTRRVSVTSDGQEANGFSWRGNISSDGRHVFFLSDADNLDPEDWNGVLTDLFVHEVATGQTSRLPLGPEGTGPDDVIRGVYVSRDGRWVAFYTGAANLVEGDTNGVDDAFVYDRLTGETRRVSVSSAGEQGDGPSLRPFVSADGRLVVFDSTASNLVPDDTNDLSDIFLHNLATGQTSRPSLGIGGSGADGMSRNAVLSPDGRFVAYFSAADNLVPGDTNGTNDAFRHDLITGETIRISVNSAGEQGDLASGYPHLSGDGSRAIFQSNATNLVPDDTNEALDVFVRTIPLNELYFAQFGDGENLLSSQILLLSLETQSQNSVRLSLKDPSGGALTVDLNGTGVTGALEGTVEPSGLWSLRTDGLGDLTVGSVVATSEWPLAGHIIFGGTVGLAGVGRSMPLDSGFLAPVEVRLGSGLRTGIAVMNLAPGSVVLSIRLSNSQGLEVSTAEAVLPNNGQLAIYLDELDWSAPVSFDDFLGSLQVEAGGKIAATVLQSRPGQLSTLPVVPIE